MRAIQYTVYAKEFGKMYRAVGVANSVAAAIKECIKYEAMGQAAMYDEVLANSNAITMPHHANQSTNSV